MTVPVSVWLREFRTNWVSCTAQTCDPAFFMSLDQHKSLHKSYVYIKAWFAEDVLRWLSQQPEEFFADGIHWLLHHWGFCWNANGDFFLTVAVPSPVTIIQWVSFVHASYTRWHICLWHYMPMWPRVAHYLGSWFVFIGIWWHSLDEGLAHVVRP